MTPRRFPIRLLAASALIAGVGVIVSGCGGDADADARPDLAFVSTRDGDYSIYEMDADGKGQRRLTETETDPSTPEGLFFQVEPAWSPNGATIAFSSRRSGRFDIFTMNADGTGTKRLTSAGADETHPTWSSNGRRLAYVREGDIYVVNTDAAGTRRISDPTAEESDPAWAPDGGWIAYVRRTPGTPVRELWIMRPDGSDRRALTAQGARVFTPAWSPDSTRLVFSSNHDGEVFELYTIGIDGAGLRSVTPTAGDMFEPSWSPDGSTIAFSEGGSIFTVELGGGDAKKLTDTENNDSSPVWNPSPPDED